MSETKRVLTWSYGGGTQSIAMMILVAQGKLPTPQHIIMADTGREATETWEYHERYVAPVMRELGLELEIASHDLASVDLYNNNGTLLLPVFTETGKFQTYCSGEWKREVVKRHLRQLGYGPKRPVLTWLGISRDEIGRLKPSAVKWQKLHWPLALDLGMTRHDCKRVIQEFGLPDPPKSSCWMCPHRRNSQWLRLKVYYPEDWEGAVALDKEIRARDSQSGVYLHDSRVPLEEADLTVPDEPELPLFGQIDGCDSGYCMV